MEKEVNGITESEKILAGYCVDEKVGEITESDAQKLTHLMIAVGRVTDGMPQLVSENGVGSIARLRKWNPDLRISVCFGGEFSSSCLERAGRLRIAEGIAQIVEKYDLDGADIDWEYPCCGENGLEFSSSDRENYTSLCRETRLALDKLNGRRRLLTSAAGADSYFTDNTEMNLVQQSLDYVHIMTYDLRGAFQVLTGHHSNLYTPAGDLFSVSADSAVKLFLGAGVPKEKIAIGAAFYSRMWNGVPNRNHGYLQIAQTNGKYGPSYTELREKYINKNGFIRYWDDTGKAPWLFNGETFLSYDDEQSIACKCNYVLQQDLAGIFYWEHGSDKTGVLLDAAARALNRKSEAQGGHRR